MRVDAFHYELPPELIAQTPPETRDQARLLHLPRLRGPIEHRRIVELPDLIPPGSLVVLNDTRVIAARLLGHRHGSGGQVEILLVKRVGTQNVEVAPGESRTAEVWRALGKANKPLRAGTDVDVPAPPPTTLRIRILSRSESDGLFEVALWTSGPEPLERVLRVCGTTPLPPYIKRAADPRDADRYQTVYARHDGAIAAPTAGLHLTGALLERIGARGCEIARVTLHVGLGTFQPVTADDLDAHPMHEETYDVPPATADAIVAARARGAPVFAVGTTTVRALEATADPRRHGFVSAGRGETRLLIQPGHRWSVVDALLTNFHVPRSTLLALVCALGGTDAVMEAYAEAVRARYRFFSYGDAMLLWRTP
ncbi:MAG TPA: tRNA preQ1(34) S-adenosylmethionine ribosyltransferase-isomerase QueA [Polyangiaceae bacterium]|jgi:S-adenosylmethionine:tRNA ribosyltransferase-isomerase